MKYKTFILVVIVLFCFGGTVTAKELGGTEISFGLLAKTVVNLLPPPKFPPELGQLEGKRIHISGFPIPYDDPEHMKKLMLVSSPGGCFFCSPPAANGIVFVRRAPGDPKLSDDVIMVNVEGTLRLWRAEMKDDDEAKGFLFTIDDAVVSPGDDKG